MPKRVQEDDLHVKVVENVLEVDVQTTFNNDVSSRKKKHVLGIRFENPK